MGWGGAILRDRPHPRSRLPARLGLSPAARRRRRPAYVSTTGTLALCAMRAACPARRSSNEEQLLIWTARFHMMQSAWRRPLALQAAR